MSKTGKTTATTETGSGGIIDRVKGWFGGGGNSAVEIDPSDTSATAEKARVDASFDAAKKRIEALENKKMSNIGVMDGGVPVGQLMSIMGDMATSTIGPGDIHYVQFMAAQENRDKVLNFMQASTLGSPDPNGAKKSTILGGIRILNDMVTKGEINSHQAGLLAHELLISATGSVIGRESIWQRMIAAGVLAAEKPLVGTVERSEMVNGLVESLKNAPTTLGELSTEAQERYTGLMQDLQNATGKSERLTIAPPPPTPAIASTTQVVPNPLTGRKEPVKIGV